MKIYAIIEINGNQFKVSEGEELLVDKLTDMKVNPKVLLVSDGEKVSVGRPYLPKVKVKIKVLEEEVKGKKLHVRKFKAKSRYRKKIGFRPLYSKVLVEKID
jgi:large subunit ribosomal protein L21